MAVQFRCRHERRRVRVAGHPTLNGIDVLEVLDRDAEPIPSPRQRTLLVRMLKDAPTLVAANLELVGGVRVTPVNVLWVHRADDVPSPPATAAERAFLGALPSPEQVLVVRTDAEGDFSAYRLRLVDAAGLPLPDLDPVLSEIEFSFKVECPSEFDCRPVRACLPVAHEEPALDYLARDYASFRRMMLDRIAALAPDWRDRNPADLGVTLVELLAYAADHLSYYQDAVATEAYLGTARRRTSVRRHARLLDYFVHEGCNARAFVAFEVAPGGAADGAALPAGTTLLTAPLDAPPVLAPADLGAALEARPAVFETMERVTLSAARNAIRFHAFGDEECCLPAGATRATLRDDPPAGLAVGDLVVFEEVTGPGSGIPADADPAHRQAVRLTAVRPGTDPLDGTRIVEVEWDAEDALRFPLCLSGRDAEGALVPDVSVVRGNVVLADHGRAVGNEPLDPASPPEGASWRPRLARRDVTYAVPFDPAASREAPAAAALEQDPRAALPAVALDGDGDRWSPQRDLLGSERFAPEFVVEPENDRTAFLRFGDGVQGKRPSPGAGFQASYRVGTGAAGNVGAGSLRQVVLATGGIDAVRNPLPARGGTDPEPLERVRLDAPVAFRVQERAVTAADYARAAGLHPEVQRAAARFRWTGSWFTVFLAIDRQGGRPVDGAFRDKLRDHLERFRLAGYDLEVEAPRFVPLDVALEVCVRPGYFASEVKRALLAALGSGALAGGGTGFFHPDRFSFGDTLYLSQLYAAASAVAGVDYVDVTRFQRWGKPEAGELAAGAIVAGPFEILELANDRSRPEAGRLEIAAGGGL